jgi:hypothetical protein
MRNLKETARQEMGQRWAKMGIREEKEFRV